jgi:transcriptional regulator with XRE-family HTH domain
MPPNRYRHPDDDTTLRWIVTDLTAARRDQHLHQRHVADRLGISHKAVSKLERGSTGTLHCATIQRHARAVNRVAVFTASGITWAPDTALVASLRAMNPTHPDRADQVALALLIAQLTAARHQAKRTQAHIGAVMGCAATAVAQIEAGRNLHLATLQRYVRALGGVLHVDLRPTPELAVAA